MRNLFYSVLFLLSVFSLSAQEEEQTEIQQLEQRTGKLEEAVGKLSKLKVSGYIQAQYQHGEKDASLKVGASNETKNTDDPESFDRFGIRRGRLKFTYTEGITQGVFELNITEKGVGVSNAYIDVRDPWAKSSKLTVGLFERPFGFEIGYSSSKIESLERSMIVQTLFPDEKDLGASLSLQPKKDTPFDFLKLQAGIFSGNAINPDVNSARDFISRLGASKNIGSIAKWGVGISYYNGRVLQTDKYVYKMNGTSFDVDSVVGNTGKYAKREYFGADGQFQVETPAGITLLMGEYIFGQQPGTAGSSKSPNGDLSTGPTYIRNFSGGYIMLVQDLGRTPFSVVGKFEYYDPNTKVKGNEIGVKGSNTSKTDLSQTSFGVGALWRISKPLRLAAYYAFNKNEKSDNIKGYDVNREDDVFTLRLQYKF